MDVNNKCYLQLDVLNGVEVTSKASFVPTGCPDLMADPRTDRCAYLLPRDQHELTKLPTDTVCSCTNKGNLCMACSMTGGIHKLNEEARIICMADEFFPAVGGVQKDCMLVWRIKGGSFAHFQALLNTQVKGLGLKLGTGTVVVTCLMTHLYRVGETTYWKDFSDFSDWAHHKYKLVVLPTITIYPTGLPWRFLSAVRRFYARLQYKNFGSSKTNPVFSLWRPFMNVIADLKDECQILPLNTEPLHIKNPADINKPILISCDGNFLHGAGTAQDWSEGMPPAMEKSFLQRLVSGVKEVQSSSALVTPSDDSIIAGLNRQAVLRAHQGRQIFLLGASNMEQLRRYILDLAVPAGVKIVNLCEKGDFLRYFLDHPELLELLKAGTSNDILFFNPMGNNVILWDEKDKKNGAWHFTYPVVTNDKCFSELMVDMNHAIRAIKKHFQGRSILMGPYPRMLKDCCMIPDHWLRDIEDERIDMLLLTDLFTEQMYKAAELPENFGFVSYNNIFKTVKFSSEHLSDHIHLTEDAQGIVADYLMQWLDKSSDPLPSKPSEGANMLPFSEVLKQEGIDLYGDDMGEEEEEEEDETAGGEDEVFTRNMSSAEAALAALKKAKAAINNPSTSADNSAANTNNMQT